MSRLSALSELVLGGSEYVVQDILEKLSWPDIQRALRADTSLVAVLNASFLLRPYLDGRRLAHNQAVVLAWMRSHGEEYESVEDVVYLNLWGDRRVTYIPAEIYTLVNLKELVLTETGITSVPRELGNLAALEELDLSDTRITNVPREFGQLTTLVRLDLYGTRVSSIPDEVRAIPGLRILQ